MKSAPGELELVREFINTFEPERPEGEKLADTNSATQWLRKRGLYSRSLTEAELAKLLTFRETLRAEVLAHNGAGDKDRSWSALGDQLRETKLLVQIGSEAGEVRLIPAAPASADAVIARLMAIMYDAIRRNEWRRLKACRKHSCLWAFYDRSKNSSGTWCDMAVCGNRIKAQRRRKRSMQ